MKGYVNIPQGQGINVYPIADTASESFAVLESGDGVDILATQGAMLQINWNGVVGWVSAKYITIDEASLNGLDGKLRDKIKKIVKVAVNPVAATKAVAKTTAATVKATSKLVKGDGKGFVKTAFATTAKTAAGLKGLGNKIVLNQAVKDQMDSMEYGNQLAKGDFVKKLAQGGTKKSGFLDKVKKFFGFKKKDSVEGILPAQAGMSAYVATQKDPLTMRDAASTSGNKITSIPRGATVTVVSPETTSANGYNWIQVMYGAYRGYVASEYLDSAAPAPAAVTTTTTTTIDNNNNQNGGGMMTLSENAKKALKIGAIGVGVAAVGYGIYKLASGGSKTKKKKKSSGGLSGVTSSKKRKSTKKIGKKKRSATKRIGYKRTPLKLK